MCRLFTYASAREQTLLDAMGATDLAAFAKLSRLHEDGWGAGWLGAEAPARDGLLADRGVRLARLRSTSPAWSDPGFADHARTSRGRAGLAHLRWGSPGMEVSWANQHPFADFSSGDEAVFAHNGDVAWVDELTEAGRRQWRAAGVEAPVWRGTTDSERYFWLVRAWHAAGAPWSEALLQACADIRRLTRPCAANAVLLTQDQLLVVHAAAGLRPRFSEAELRRAAAAGLPSDHTEVYYDVGMRRDADQVVLASSGLPAEGWEPTPDETVVVVDLATLVVTTSAIR